MLSLRNGCGFLKLAKLRQLECAQGFIYFMYNLLEMLGKVMEFIWPSRSAVWGDSPQLLPVRAPNPLIQRSLYQRRWASQEVSRIAHTHHLNPARPAFPSSPYPE